MAFVGNLLWFLFGGLELGLGWVFLGALWCCTVVGIPFGLACFRISRFCFFPFGKDIIPCEMLGEKRILGTGLFNFIWVIFSGLWLAIGAALVGVGWCCTIVGIPLGVASFHIAKASFAPLGKRVVSKDIANAARAKYVSAKVDAMVNK